MPTATLTDATALRDGQWYRLHPLTPVLQGGVVVAGILGFSLAALWETVFLRVILVILGVDEDEIPESDFLFAFLESVTTFGLLIVVAAVVTAGALWLQWRVHTVRMDDDVIEVKKGVIFRTSRRTRRDRVNTIGVRRPLIPRMLGLAKLDIQAAGSESNMVLAYLPHAIAQAVRQEILEPVDATDEPEDPEPLPVRREVEVPLFRYLASLVVSLESVVLAIALTVTVTAAWLSGELVSWLAVIIALFVFVVYLADRFFRVGSFVIDTIEGDIRVSLGLLSTSVETIPPERIHAVQISQPWPWRFFGWWRVDANLASSPGSQVSKAPAHTMIIPVATTEEMQRIVSLALPSLDTTSSTVIPDALEMSHEEWVETHPQLTHTLGSPTRARYRIPVSASVNGVALHHGILFLRTGQWIKKLSLVPLARVQSLAIGVGPWHEALKLGFFRVHSVSGPVKTTAPAFDRDELDAWWASLTDEALGAIAAYRPRVRSRTLRNPS